MSFYWATLYLTLYSLDDFVMRLALVELNYDSFKVFNPAGFLFEDPSGSIELG